MRYFIKIFIFSLILLEVSCEDFHPDRTRLIDTFKGKFYTNYIFRGNMPVLNESFSYKELIGNLGEVLQKQNMTFPSSNFYMLDVTYVNSYLPGEEEDLSIEEKFWEANPAKGRILHWPIIGSALRPPGNEDVVKGVVKNYIEHSEDRLDLKIPELHSLLNTEFSDSSWVIYSHCEAGVDRTGEMSGAYYMQYLDMSFQDALKVDDSIIKRDMYEVSRNALQWYCYYLKFEKGMGKLECV